ncbi:MAG: hypothetical protein ACJAVD_001397 [Porticoccaceae bacterium]|jgi:hypothetical protein
MKEQLKTIQLIHLALILGVVFAYYFLSDLSSFNDLFTLPDINSSTIYIAIIPMIAFVSGNLVFKSMLSKIDKKIKVEDNFGAYQTASVVRWVILKGTAFFIITTNTDFILFGVVLIIYLALLRPSESTIQNDLKNI